jgi:hypothetical protein
MERISDDIAELAGFATPSLLVFRDDQTPFPAVTRMEI